MIDINKGNLKLKQGRKRDVTDNDNFFNSEQKVKATKIEDLNYYIEGELYNKDDISYEWIKKEKDVELINKAITIEKVNKIDELLTRRDFSCELQLIKFMTEDRRHKEILLDVPKINKKLNRYADIVPCNYFLKI